MNEDLANEKTPPEIIRWEVELRRLLMGEKALDVLRLGGAAEYIAALLRRERDRAASATALQEALRLIVIEARPEDWRLTSVAACFLDLVAAFRPAGGFVKIMGLLRGPWPYGERLKVDQTYPATHDLHFKALGILRLYFPVPPSDERLLPAFNAYIALLRDHLPSGPHIAYALTCLLELGEIQPEDAEFRTAVTGPESTLEEILNFLVPSGLLYLSPEMISRIYVECMRISQNMERRFEVAIAEAGGKINDTWKGCNISLPDGRIAHVRIPWSDKTQGAFVAEYMESRHQRAVELAEQAGLLPN